MNTYVMLQEFIWWRLKMNKIGLIGTAAYLQFENLQVIQRVFNDTPYGMPEAPLVYGLLEGRQVVLLSRNKDDSSVPPHRIN